MASGALAITWIVVDFQNPPSPSPRPALPTKTTARAHSGSQPGGSTRESARAPFADSTSSPSQERPGWNTRASWRPALSAQDSERNPNSAHPPSFQAALARRKAAKAPQPSEVRSGPEFRLPLFYSLTPQQIAASIPGVTAEGLQVLKDDFEAQAGVGEFSPEDPAYAEHWKEAEITLEQRMRLWYGWGAWAALQHQTALQAAANQGN